jgi:hypothetical protein
MVIRPLVDEPAMVGLFPAEGSPLVALEPALDDAPLCCYSRPDE